MIGNSKETTYPKLLREFLMAAEFFPIVECHSFSENSFYLLE